MRIGLRPIGSPSLTRARFIPYRSLAAIARGIRAQSW
jgi:hypothetical protein